MASVQRARRKMCPCATLLVAAMCKGSLPCCAAAQKPSTSLPPPPPSRPWNPLIPSGKPGMSAGASNNGDTRLLVSPTKTARTVTVPDVTLKSSGFPGAPTQISRAGSSIGISSQGPPASQESAEGQHASSASSIAAASIPQNSPPLHVPPFLPRRSSHRPRRDRQSAHPGAKTKSQLSAASVWCDHRCSLCSSRRRRTWRLRVQSCLVGDGPGDPCRVAVFPILGLCWCHLPIRLHV